MSNKWQNRNEIGGILRKGNSTSSNPEARTVDLLVFGYACKIFRDDAKAREIDQGKHLIPWMADANLKIDRYDVRGALYDLTPYEPPPGGYGNRLDYLTSEEQRAEQLCEEERYYYLYRNEQEEILYQEEELKRLQQESGSDSTYNQVQFNYDMPLGPNRDDNSSELGPDNEADKVFSLPKNFEVPPSIQLPETMKQHAIIEKTARFISAQGPQMEILIKAKQSNNQQFDFLTQNNPLNVYYKFVLSALKSGTYPEPEAETPDPLSEDNSNTTTNNSSFEDPFSKPYIPVPTIKYTPSANCAYTQLISKIKGVPLPPPEPEKQQQSIYMPVLLQQNAAHSVEKGDAANVTAVAGVKNHSKVEIQNVPNALMLAHYYSSDTDNEGDQSDEEKGKEEKEKEIEKEPEPDLCFPIPPDYLQNIIDKTAGYVIKNGRQFEETLRIKNDERFTFLFPDSEFYSYYMYKVTGEVKSYVPSEEDEDKQKVASGPVSFSIKAKDDQPVSVIRPALPQEASDDESENKVKSNGAHVGEQGQLPQQQQQPSRTVPEHVQKAIQLVESQLMARNAQLGIPTVQNRTRFDIDHTGTMAPKLPTTPSVLIAADDPPVKLVNNHQKELKRAEEKVKDKLAQIAREKLGGLLSKEKQLQIERKKKAMAFLNQIKGATQSTVGDNATKFLSKSSTNAKDADDSDTSSVHSIPISSYGDDRSDTEACNNPSNNNEHKEDVPIDADADDDDDDVQLITIEPKKRHSRPRTRPYTQTPEVVIISPKRSRSISRHSVKRSKSKSHKSKKKSSKRSHHSKKKSKKRSRSHSTHRSRSFYSDEDEELYSSSDSSSRKRRKRSLSHKKKKSRRHER